VAEVVPGCVSVFHFDCTRLIHQTVRPHFLIHTKQGRTTWTPLQPQNQGNVLSFKSCVWLWVKLIVDFINCVLFVRADIEETIIACMVHC
jgi:hypothetical protein